MPATTEDRALYHAAETVHNIALNLQRKNKLPLARDAFKLAQGLYAAAGFTNLASLCGAAILNTYSREPAA